MKKEILTEYAEKVYGYAFRRTYSVEEAEDLSQEILLTALSAMDKLTDDAKFEPWLWALAANVTKSFRRHIGKQRAMFTYDSFPEDIAEEADEDCEEEESRIREKIAYLSRAYREIILLHYYDNLGVSEIAERLGLPVGTVTWRLSEARKKLKKEYISMVLENSENIKIISDCCPGLIPFFKYYEFKIAELMRSADRMGELARCLYKEYSNDRGAVAAVISKHPLGQVGFKCLDCNEDGHEVLMKYYKDRLEKLIPEYFEPDDLHRLFYSEK